MRSWTTGRVRVDGAARKPSHRVATGRDGRPWKFLPRRPRASKPKPIPLEVLYEDDDIAVVNKPAGMIVHPGAGADSGTLVAALLHRFGGSDGLSSIGGPHASRESCIASTREPPARS